MLEVVQANVEFSEFKGPDICTETLLNISGEREHYALLPYFYSLDLINFGGGDIN